MSSRLNSHLSKKQLQELKDKVLAEMERIQNKMSSEFAQFDPNLMGAKDEVDSANDQILAHTQLRFATRETLYLKKLKKTLQMVDSEEYGMCEECGAQITFQRLIARPTSTMCISCKEESERDESQNVHGRQSKSLGKQVNLSGR